MEQWNLTVTRVGSSGAGSTISLTQPSSRFGVAINTRPNTLGDDLDQLTGPNLDWQPTRIDDHDARIATMPGDGRQLARLDDNMYVTATSTTSISDDELSNIIRGVRFTNADEFRQIGSAIAAHGNADIASWDGFDRMTTPDGVA